MDMYTNIAIIISLAVFINYLNYRFIKIQPNIAIMATSLLVSVALLILDKLGLHSVHHDVVDFISQLHFQEFLMNFMLGLLLFAGSLTIDISQLKKQKWDIAILASVCVLVSAFITGFAIYYLLGLIGIHLDLIYCLLFGALISPTDPIAVLSVFKRSNAPKKLSLAIAAESLFNDGIGVVLFVSIYHVAFSNQLETWGSISTLFLHKALGGLGFGLILSLLAYLLMKPIDDHKTEILLTLALVTGGYTLAQAIGVSGPLAMVTVGIFIASRRHGVVISHASREHIETFWALIDELLNAILFLLLGFEILVVPFSVGQLTAALFAIPLVLAARYISIFIPMGIIKSFRRYPPYSIRIMTWGGVRGGLAIALALAVPAGTARDIILPMTYAVVLFSIFVQGITIKPLVKRCKIAHQKLKEKKSAS